MMEYIKATLENLTQVHEIVQETIKTIYPKYYPKEVVDFFSQLHNKDNIEKDILNQSVGILVADDIIVGTGCYQENHITRVYVLPMYQKKGYGNYIMKCLEDEIAQKFKAVFLDASLPASHLYEKRGYATMKHEKWQVENDVVLVYEIMEKRLTNNTGSINYDGRFFTPKFNSDNGEVDAQTLFAYHQDGENLFAEYSGGEVERGQMLGKVSFNGELDFYYQHINKMGNIMTGKCHSIPHILDNGKIELQEEWQWLNGDKSKGTSIVTER